MKIITKNVTKHLFLIHRYLFYSFIFLLPWHTIYILREVFFNAEKWQYGTIGIYFSDIILISWIILSVYLYKNNILKYILKQQKLIIICLLLSIWSFISIFWSDDKMLAFYFATKLFFVLNLFLLIQIVPIKLRNVSIVFVLSVVLQSFIGLLQFITQQTFSQKIFGLNFYDVWRGGTAIINTDTERWLRIYGGMPHPNIFGGLLLCALLFTIYFYLTTTKNIYKFFLLASICLFTINILFTFSRTIWITSLLCIFFTIIYIYKNTKDTLQKIIAPLLILLSTIILLVFFYQSIFLTRVSENSTTTHNSLSDRVLYLQQSKELILEHIIFGTGIGNYTNVIYFTNNVKNPIWQIQPVHNIYLLITAEIGVIGCILFILFIFVIIYNIYLNKKNINLLQFMFILLFFSFLFISLFDHWLWTSHFGLLLFFVITGFSIKNITLKD